VSVLISPYGMEWAGLAKFGMYQEDIQRRTQRVILAQHSDGVLGWDLFTWFREECTKKVESGEGIGEEVCGSAGREPGYLALVSWSHGDGMFVRWDVRSTGCTRAWKSVVSFPLARKQVELPDGCAWLALSVARGLKRSLSRCSPAGSKLSSL